MRRKRPAGDGGGDSWLNTYADMVTLLLTFFAVLLSMSSVNQVKFNAFIRSFSNLPQEEINEIIENAGLNEDEIEDPADPLPSEVEQAMTELYEKLKEYVKENEMEDTVSIDKVNDVIYVRFESSMFFEADKYEMLPGSTDSLSFVGDAIIEYEPLIEVVAVCGHTAMAYKENYPVSDWMLSCERAAVVSMYFDNQKGFNSKKILPMGYGHNMPIADNSTEEGKKQNRRVEIAVIGVGSDVSVDPYEGLSNLYGISEANNNHTTVPGQSADSTEGLTSSSDGANAVQPADVQQSVSPFE